MPGFCKGCLLPEGRGAQRDGTAGWAGDTPVTVSTEGAQDGPCDSSWRHASLQVPWEASGDKAVLRLGLGLGTVQDQTPPGQVCSDQAGPRPGWNLSMGWGLDQQGDGQAGAELWWSWGPVLLSIAWAGPDGLSTNGLLEACC